jgi:hypothetical protein
MEPNSQTITGLLSPAYFLTKHGFRRPDSLLIRGLSAARLASTSPQLTFSPGWDQAYRITRFDVEQFLVTAISRDFDEL